MGDYTMEASYANYLLESMMQEETLNRCIQEALIITEGVAVKSKLQSLNEGVGDKIKEIWQKFVAFIKRIYGKFAEVMNKVLDNDAGYLEKYQKIIQNKPFKLDVTCRDYQLDRVVAAQVPLFNYSMLQSKLTSKAVFMHSVIPAFGENDNADDLNGWCKAYFCNGKEEEVKLSNINMTDFYNYCHDFKDKTLPRLKQDESNIDKSAANANSLIVSAINDSQKKAQAQEQSQNTQNNQQQSQTQNQTQNQNPATKQESVLNPYSALLGRVLSELKIENNAPQAAQNNSTPNEKRFSSNAAGATGDGETKETATKTVDNDNSLTEEKVNEIIGIYSSVTSAVASSKITIAQWAYNDYMKIIRAHVQMYAGQEDNTPNQSAKAGTDYSNNGNQQNAQPQNQPQQGKKK